MGKSGVNIIFMILGLLGRSRRAVGEIHIYYREFHEPLALAKPLALARDAAALEQANDRARPAGRRTHLILLKLLNLL